MNIDELYQTIILDHYREKHHSGLRDPFDVEVHHVNPSCGDEIMLRVHLDGDVVAEAWLVDQTHIGFPFPGWVFEALRVVWLRAWAMASSKFSMRWFS